MSYCTVWGNLGGSIRRSLVTTLCRL